MGPKTLIVLSTLICANAFADFDINLPDKKLTVAVIDTGLNIDIFKDKIKLCKFGHRDFTGTGIEDNHGHGSHVSGLIDANSDGVDYCQVIMKYYDPKSATNNLQNTIKAFQWAIDLNVDVINYSGGGLEPSEKERQLILKALDKGIKVVVAAGNEGCNMDEKFPMTNISKCTYYPAMYDDRIVVVGNLKMDSKLDRVPAKSSNSGSIVDIWEIGSDLKSYCTNGNIGCSMTGTSQATAVVSGKVLKQIKLNRKNISIEKLMMLVCTV